MSYKTDGSPHKNGTAAEEDIARLINEDHAVRDAYMRASGIDKSNFIEAEKKGGTRLLQDIVLNCLSSDILKRVGVSHKQQARARASRGTFDWGNLSSLIPKLSEKSKTLHELREYFAKNRGLYKGKSKDFRIKEEMKAELNERCSECLDSLGSDTKTLRFLLTEAFKKYESGNNILISVGNSETHTLQVFPSSCLPIFKYLQDTDRYSFFLAIPKRHAKTSRQVYVLDHKTKEEINTDLRVRLTTNNGVGAWLGGKGWSSNSSASLTFKLQQDNVRALLSNMVTHSEIVNYGGLR